MSATKINRAALNSLKGKTNLSLQHLKFLLSKLYEDIDQYKSNPYSKASVVSKKEEIADTISTEIIVLNEHIDMYINLIELYMPKASLISQFKDRAAFLSHVRHLTDL